MSKASTIHETSKFLKNLREVTKLKTKTPSAPQTANAAQKSRPTENNPNRRDKAPNQRHSHPYYFSAEQQCSPIPSANTSQLPVKSHSKPKTAHMTNIEGILYSVMEQHKKKIITSTSQYDPEFSEDPSMQFQANPLAVSSINAPLKNSQLEAAITRQLSNPLKDHRKGNSEPKKTTSLAHITAHSIPNSSSKTNSNKVKGRKSVATDYKGRVMTQAEEPVLPRIPVPYQAQRRAISPARFEGRAQNASKSPLKNIPNIPMSPELIQAGEDVEYVERTPKQGRQDNTPGGSKPPRPLKEIKIDIANLVDEPVVTGNSTNNRASTSRNQAQNIFSSHRGEKGKQEKPTTSSKPWVPISTPQSAATQGQGGGKQRLSLATPKKDQVVSVKDNARMVSLKSLLSEEEIRQYGDRFPDEFEKTDFLGRGGFALVWLGVEKKTNKKLAVKQILKGAASDSQKKELYFGQLLFNKGGEPRDELKRYPGIENIAKFIEHRSTKVDDWHLCELGGKTLAKQVFDLKGEFFKSERIYKVNHLKLYQAFRSDGISLRMFVKQMAQVLYLLSDLKIVHCDLKPDNILISLDNHTPGKPFDLKVIDFGSAYHWDACGNIGMATPEYMPPEFLDVLISHRANKSSIEQLADIAHPWSIDVWSLGAIILEIITGIPLWMSLKCRVDTGNKNAMKLGLFAVKGRSYDKIYQKQRSIMEKFGEVMSDYLDGWRDAEDLYSLLSQMMEWDPSRRLSPAEILQHPYLRDI